MYRVPMVLVKWQCTFLFVLGEPEKVVKEYGQNCFVVYNVGMSVNVFTLPESCMVTATVALRLVPSEYQMCFFYEYLLPSIFRT